MKQYDLHIFDVDGTIAERDTTDLLPGVAEWFAANQTAVALATNQGGVGLRHWMIEGNFGDPSKYPDEIDVKVRMRKLRKKLGIRSSNVFISFAYQSKTSGKWNPVVQAADEEWSQEWRKPSPGMLIAAMRRNGAKSAVMVGDSDEDRAAARAAGIDFIHANEFFGRN